MYSIVLASSALDHFFEQIFPKCDRLSGNLRDSSEKEILPRDAKSSHVEEGFLGSILLSGTGQFHRRMTFLLNKIQQLESQSAGSLRQDYEGNAGNESTASPFDSI